MTKQYWEFSVRFPHPYDSAHIFLSNEDAESKFPISTGKTT